MYLELAVKYNVPPEAVLTMEDVKVNPDHRHRDRWPFIATRSGRVFTPAYILYATSEEQIRSDIFDISKGPKLLGPDLDTEHFKHTGEVIEVDKNNGGVMFWMENPLTGRVQNG